MSQKVNVKSLRAPRWGSPQSVWYCEKNYGAFIQKNLMYTKLLFQIFGKSLSVRVTKAPAKRRLHKPYYLFSGAASKFVGSLFITNPLVSAFPKKGLSAKYGPYTVQKPKKFKKFSKVLYFYCLIVIFDVKT